MIINHLFLVLPKGTLGNSVDPEQTPQNVTAHINMLNFCKIIQIKINQKPLNDKYVRSFWKDRRIKLIKPPHDKPTKWHVRPAKTQTSLGIRPAWPESSPCAQWVAKDPSFLNEDSENSGHQSLLGAHAILLVLSWGGSNVFFFHSCYRSADGLSSMFCLFSSGQDSTYLFSNGPRGNQVMTF